MILHNDKENFDIAIRAASRYFNISPAIIEKDYEESTRKLLFKPESYEDVIKALKIIAKSGVFEIDN